MRIVHIGVASDVPVLHRFGGAVQRRIWELSRVQARRGHEVAIYSFGPEDRVEQRDGVEIRYLRCRSPHPVRQLEFQVRALRHLDRTWRKVDLLHAHGQPEAAVLFRRRATCTALSYDYFRFRGGHGGPFGGATRAALQQFDLLMPCSEYCRVESSEYWKLDPGGLFVLPNGVSLEQFRPDAPGGDAERRERGLASPIVLYVGRLCDQKGTSLLLDAWPRRRMRPDARLVLVGPVERFGTADDGSWRNRIEAAGGTYLGPVEEDRLARTYAMATLFVMPTIELEMFGMAAVEAQACGVPALASDHGGLRETVPDDVGGRFRNGDPVDLATRLDALLADESGWSVRSAAAVRSASRYSWDSVADRLESHLSARGLS